MFCIIYMIFGSALLSFAIFYTTTRKVAMYHSLKKLKIDVLDWVTAQREKHYQQRNRKHISGCLNVLESSIGEKQKK